MTGWYFGARSGRPLPTLAEDGPRLPAVSRGEFSLHGFRNGDLQAILFTQPATHLQDASRRRGWVGLLRRLLGAHGLPRRTSGTNRY